MHPSRWTPWLIATLVCGALVAMWWLSAIFAPVLIGLLLAWVLLPLNEAVAARLGSRGRAAGLLIGGFALAGLLLAAVAVPMLIHEGRHWVATASGEGHAAATRDLQAVIHYGQWADPDADVWDANELATAAQKAGAPAATVAALRLAQPSKSDQALRLAEAMGDLDGDGRLEPGYAKRFRQLSRDRKSWLGGALFWLDKNGVVAAAQKWVKNATQRDKLAQLWAGGTLSAAGDVGLRLLGSVRQAMSSALAVVVGALLVPLYAFFFLIVLPDWRRALPEYLPATGRDKWLRVLGRIGGAIAGFVRGRLVVCSIVAALTAIGWMVLGVRLGLLLGLAVGALTVVPLANVAALVPALAICLVDVASDVHGWGWFGGVVAVYAVGQIAESVLNPIIVGDAVQLDMVTIIVAFLVGAAVAGLVGLLLAVPVAATLRILAEELLLPRWRLWAADRDQAAPDLAASPDAGSPPH